MSIASGPPDRGRPPIAEDFARVEAIFAEIVGLTGDARMRALDAACRDRIDIRREIEALLAAHDRMAESDPDQDPVIAAGAQVGSYRLVEKIGEGGMGEVFLAERADGLFTQQVAVKITRSTIGHGEHRRRFAVERQILASLKHENIVRLLDGGTTATGQAFLIMEHVDGVQLTTHCSQHALPLESRLALFQQICQAVQYAHQHGVVHRDLKPANVLVGADGIPKVVDFGVAKLLEADPGSGVTSTGMPGPLTPNYASPEQVRGLAVTTASDVYSLGVILYELLAGVRPYETQGQTLERVLELVVHEQPRQPSDVNGSTTAARLPYSRSRLRGDLDAIVLKAMRKEPGERYASARELAGDLTRFLDGDPVLARAPSTLYVLRRLAARHKPAVTLAAIALIGVLTASGVALWQWQTARRAQERAEQRFREVRQLANALIFKIHDAVQPLAGSTPVRRTIVDEALAYLERLEAESGGDVALRLELAAAYRQIGGILGNPGRPNLGDREGAITQYERARAIAAPLATGTAPFEAVSALVEANRTLADLHSRKNDTDRAIAIAREAVDHAARYSERSATDSRALPMLAGATFQLASILPPSEATSVWRRALGYYEQLLAAEPDVPRHQRNVALVDKYLGTNLQTVGDEEGARKHYERALELDEQRLVKAPTDRQTLFDTAISVANVANLAERRGDLDEAVRQYERSVAIRTRVVDMDPKDVQARDRLAYALVRLAKVHRGRGDIRAALPPAREAIRVQQSVFDVTKDITARWTLAYAWLELAHLERASRDPEAACGAFRHARDHYGPKEGWQEIPELMHGAEEAGHEADACDGRRE